MPNQKAVTPLRRTAAESLQIRFNPSPDARNHLARFHARDRGAIHSIPPSFTSRSSSSRGIWNELFDVLESIGQRFRRKIQLTQSSRHSYACMRACCTKMSSHSRPIHGQRTCSHCMEPVRFPPFRLHRKQHIYHRQAFIEASVQCLRRDDSDGRLIVDTNPLFAIQLWDVLPPPATLSPVVTLFIHATHFTTA